jgi:hypothetical protein
MKTQKKENIKDHKYQLNNRIKRSINEFDELTIYDIT